MPVVSAVAAVAALFLVVCAPFPRAALLVSQLGQLLHHWVVLWQDTLGQGRHEVVVCVCCTRCLASFVRDAELLPPSFRLLLDALSVGFVALFFC